MNDLIKLVCVSCKKEFEFVDKDQKFFEMQGWEPPKRCKPCRIKKKAEKSMNMSNKDGYR